MSDPHSPTPPRAAYIHVPFCRHRCGYCNFTVVANRRDLMDDYLKAIAIELSWLQTPREVNTLFIGGGTPTQMPVALLRQLLALLREWFPLSDAGSATGAAGEFTVEANPENISPAIVDELERAGVNRISLGVQSFSPDKLSALERSHTASEVKQCIELLRPRIDALSLDLIFAAPHETLGEWHSDLTSALELAPDHLSTYGLTFELGTRFFARRAKNQLVEASEELASCMYETAIDKLQSAGFEHYEVSNFARPGFRCRHNENYWFGGEFYGIGPGAASYVNGCRNTNHRSTTTYLKRVLAGRSPIAESETLSSEQRARERLVFGLRRLDGVSANWFHETTGFELEAIAGPHLGWLLDEGLLDRDADVIRLSRRGLLVSDSIWPYLI